MVWAADPHEHLAVNIIFRDANGGMTLETLRMAAAYCVSYNEMFQQGDAANGAYQAFVTLADPSGFTMQVGGLALDLVVPATGTHGSPLAAAVVATAPAIAAASGGKAKLVPGTPAHKAARWTAYQAKHVGDPKAWS